MFEMKKKNANRVKEQAEAHARARLAVAVERVVDRRAALDVELEVLEGLAPLGAEVHVHALDEGLRVPLEEARDDALDARALHLLLEAVAEHAVELLRVGGRLRVGEGWREGGASEQQRAEREDGRMCVRF
jgi:hypothetical protein